MKMLTFFVVFPLLSAFLTVLFAGKAKGLGNALSILTPFVLLVLSLYCASLVHLHKAVVYKVGGWMPPLGICMVADGLSSFMLATVNLVSLLAMVYALSYMRTYTQKWGFQALFMLMLAGMNGVILSGDLFNLYVCLELASVSGYILVAFGVEPADLEASFKYAVMGAVASIFILLGIGILYSYTSTLNMADMAFVLSGKPAGVLVGFVSVLFLAGFGLKAALVPFHAWLPDAHSCAPTPVSAVLSGVFIKTLGIYALVRVFFNILGASGNLLTVLMVLGILSMVVGAFLAIAQTDIKRMFAYSSISQVGYIIFALGIGTPFAILGGLFHLFNHALFKSLLFLDAGIIEYSTGERSLNKLGGLNRFIPSAGYTSLIGAMSISGIPPLGGFWSKLIIILAAIGSGHTGFALVAVLVSIITLAYYLKFQTFAFFGKSPFAPGQIRMPSFSMKLAVVMLAGVCLFTGLLLIPRFSFFLQGAVDSVLAGNGYKDLIFGALK